MKKIKIELSKTLVLSKEMISALTEEKQLTIKGGLTNINCDTAGNTCPWTLCVGCTQTQVVQTNCPPFVCNTNGC